MGIFTHTAFSPGDSWRQFLSRETFHAGRNLPDKGLRYFNTVRVTADVYWRFGPLASLCSKTEIVDVPALVRSQFLYILLRVWAGTCVFDKQSLKKLSLRPPPLWPQFSAINQIFWFFVKLKTKWWGKPISRSYGRLFAEFLQELSPVHLGALTPAYLCRF